MMLYMYIIMKHREEDSIGPSETQKIQFSHLKHDTCNSIQMALSKQRKFCLTAEAFEEDAGELGG